MLKSVQDKNPYVRDRNRTAETIGSVRSMIARPSRETQKKIAPGLTEDDQEGGE